MAFFKDDKKKQNPNSLEEQTLASEISLNQKKSETARRGFTPSGVDYSTEDQWDDDYKMKSGDQWSTSIAYRTRQQRKIRPNSVDNFVFQAVNNIVANVTASDPEVSIEGNDEGPDKEVAEKLTYLSRFNDGPMRNNFPSAWDKIVDQFVSYGPAIGAVLWDSDWIGGTGPNRWIGDVRMLYIDRRYIYFDPAITDLEERLQECSFINRKYRKKVSYIKERWSERGEYVTEDTNDSELIDEGTEPKQVWLHEYRHRGLPKYMPKERIKELKERSEALKETDPYKSKELLDMAQGKVKGVHVAYMADGVLLEYLPYEYDDGLYPFAYKVCYFDENSQHGFGEIRNIKVPQIMHNKADEIEIEAMAREGLGGGYYNDGAILSKQLEEIKRHGAKGGVWLKVNQIQGMKDREGVKTPASLVQYKEQKQRMVETISQNTPIQQGMAPKAGMPYAAIAELGARTDIGTKKKVSKLESFLIEMNKLRINRFIQFYTEDRYYRVKGSDKKTISGNFNANEAMQTWERQTVGENGEAVAQEENFVPEFDISVKIMDEKPTDRNYYTQTAVSLFPNAIDLESLWFTLEEGRFPPKDDIIERLIGQNNGLAIGQLLANVPPEAQQEVMQQIQAMVGQIAGQMEGDQGGEEAQGPPPEQMDAFLDALPEEVLAALQQLPEGEREQHVMEMMQMQPDELEAHMMEMIGMVV